LQRAPNFSFKELKHNKTKVTEGYCWPITQAVGRSCCGRTFSSVLEFEFKLVYTYTVRRIHTQFRLA